MPKDLIERARQFAALAERITPGPWYVTKGAFGVPELGRTTVINHKTEEDGWWQIRSFGHVGVLLADLRLAAAAPEMAKLLAEMADELEKLSAFWDWARMVDKMQFLTEHNHVVNEACD